MSTPITLATFNVAPSLPTLVAPDQSAARRFVEFFTANIRNPHTRKAYARAATEFAACMRARQFVTDTLTL